MATGALTEEVAINLEEVAEATRRIDTRSVGFFLGGVGVGVALGFYFGYRFNKEKLRAEAYAQSEKEVEQIREVYQQKTIAAEPKPSVEDIIEEKGYISTEEVEHLERPLPAPVPVREPRAVPIRTEEAEKDKNDGWSYPAEMAKRRADRPYIIHQDEFATNETEYGQVTLTYYSGDEILADEQDTVLNNVDTLIGLDNLKRFGHGADDMNVLFVRNPVIELEYEICRSPGSYEQEVMGLEHSDYRRRHPNRSDDDERN